MKGSPEYDAELEKMWTEYDPKTANDLLDKLGLTKGADGMRKRPDGQPLQWQSSTLIPPARLTTT